MRPRLAVLALGSLLSLLPGCISYSLDRLEPAAPLPHPPAPDQRPTVSFSTRHASSSWLETETGGFPELSPGRLRQEFGASLARSGWLRVLDEAPGSAGADLHLDVVLHVRANDTILLASAMLAFVIPTWRTVEFDLVVEAQHADGRWKRYQLHDAARDIHWLPLLLGMSFAPWGEAYGDVRDNQYRTLLAALHADGLLVPAPAPEPAPALSP
jgi:hypothetical protein